MERPYCCVAAVEPVAAAAVAAVARLVDAAAGYAVVVVDWRAAGAAVGLAVPLAVVVHAAVAVAAEEAATAVAVELAAAVAAAERKRYWQEQVDAAAVVDHSSCVVDQFEQFLPSALGAAA